MDFTQASDQSRVVQGPALAEEAGTDAAPDLAGQAASRTVTDEEGLDRYTDIEAVGPAADQRDQSLSVEGLYQQIAVLTEKVDRLSGLLAAHTANWPEAMDAVEEWVEEWLIPTFHRSSNAASSTARAASPN